MELVASDFGLVGDRQPGNVRTRWDWELKGSRLPLKTLRHTLRCFSRLTGLKRRPQFSQIWRLGMSRIEDVFVAAVGL